MIATQRMLCYIWAGLVKVLVMSMVVKTSAGDNWNVGSSDGSDW